MATPNFGTPEKRRLLRLHWAAVQRELDKRERGEVEPWETLNMPAFPEEIRGLMCGAKTRSGRPCKQLVISPCNGRCKFHGGHSTGPRTRKGKARAALNGLQAKRAKKCQGEANP